ncbi:hypothetical protein [uncultured Sphingomonas sp.]|uniref:hypothetical protein n=1 Tax=uncultured Sphingomonas sp. TaxID=158754 RepID=UPI0025DD4B21|nr:hypothetical protein [uncultured Sphingomonas sp.]
MRWAQPRGDGWQEVVGSFIVRDIEYPANWPEDERRELGQRPIVEALPIVAWQREVRRELLDVDGAPVETIVAETIDLAAWKASQTGQVNAAAGALRRRFITDITGQQATYLAKETEAEAWVEGADPADFPYLACEAAAIGQTIGEVAALCLATSGQWRLLDPKIEGARRGAAVAIDAADTHEAALAAAQVDWDTVIAA